jgi:hypothetical protein
VAVALARKPSYRGPVTRILAALIAGAVLTVSFVAAGPATAAPKLSKKAALRKTAKVARSVAKKQQNQGAVGFFAFGCKRKSRSVVTCVGGVTYADNSGCIQRVRNRRRGGGIKARRVGRILCGSIPSEAGGGGGGGESTAICAIRQSVCI